MKKTCVLGMVVMLILVSAVLAQEQGADEAAKRVVNETGAQPVIYKDNGTVPEKVDTVRPDAQAKAKQVEVIKEQLQEQQRVMEQDRQAMGEDAQKAYMNQNQVRLAVHALQAIGNMTGGGIGKNISALAKEFNNSVQATIRAEERIQKKSGFARFFSGGDKESGETLAAEADKNQERIQELRQLREECECDEAVKEMLREQIQSMEQEQSRLQELAEKEQRKKGLLGWIWK